MDARKGPTLVVVATLAALVVGVAARADDALTLRAAYHVDRWGQPRFGYLFVDPALHERLASFAGRTVALQVQKLDSDSGQDGFLASRIGTIEPLGDDVRWSVVFKSGPADFIQVSSGEAVTIAVAATNATGGDVTLSCDWADRIEVEVSSRSKPRLSGREPSRSSSAKARRRGSTRDASGWRSRPRTRRSTARTRRSASGIRAAALH